MTHFKQFEILKKIKQHEKITFLKLIFNLIMKLYLSIEYIFKLTYLISQNIGE